jgi:hypothetical protein
MVELIDVRLLALPLYSPELEVPDEARRFVDAV